MSQRRVNVISKSPNPRHGHVFSPKSRAYFAWEAGKLDYGALNQRESGKFFPATVGDLHDPYAPQDQTSFAPPPDGKIASANQATGAMLDEPGSHWQKHPVCPGEVLEISGYFAANHVSRRWVYFLTKKDWDPGKVLSRDQFEPEPFYTVQINLQPFWEHSEQMKPPTPTVHGLPLPERSGYHVLLAVWEVADTPNAFYQVVDLDFVPPDGGGERPSVPTGLKAVSITDKQVELAWKESDGPAPIAFYRIKRNGTMSVDVPAPALTWTDKGVLPQTHYSYVITAHDEAGEVSDPSRPLQVQTLPEGGGPSAPINLHSMGQTTQSITLMWGASTGTAPIVNYLIYRDGVVVKSLSATQTEYEDTGLTPDTEYRYEVKALDLDGKLSPPSNLLRQKTKAEGGGHPAWKLDTFYETGALVSHGGGIWRCLQRHTSYAPDWAPGLDTSEVLWAAHTPARK